MSSNGNSTNSNDISSDEEIYVKNMLEVVHQAFDLLKNIKWKKVAVPARQNELEEQNHVV